MNTPIKAERLYITELSEEMAESIHINSLDDDNRRFLPDEVFETVDKARAAISTLKDFYTNNDSPLVYAVALNDGRQIGHVQAVPTPHGWEIGYHIGSTHTGNGYATEAVRAFLIPIMGRLGISRLYGSIHADNAASRRVLEKCGFTLEYQGDGTFFGMSMHICRYAYSIVKTERLLIRPFSPDDWPGLYDYLSQPQVVEFEPYEPYSVEAAKHEAIKRSQDRNFHAVCLKDPFILIGNIYLAERDYNSWELGYVFNSLYWHSGYATEAIRALITQVIKDKPAHRLYALCNPKNERSWRLLERLGFRREGHFKQNVYFKKDDSGNPIWQDTFEYGMLADEWDSLIFRKAYRLKRN